MRTFQSLGIVSLLFVAANCAAEGLCEIAKRCENGCYTAVSRVTDIQTSPNFPLHKCDDFETSSEEFVSVDLPLDWAPLPVALDCAGAPGSRTCEVFPQGESITYSWSGTGSFHAGAGTAANPFRNFSCTSGTTGTITVTAYSPQGAASSASTVVSCP